MGRKPNALILRFFERGAKLEDSSNRYQHTCRACGEKFPKGRIDSLQTHITKKCPAISIRDRQKALLELNDLPDLPESRNGIQQGGQTVELPVENRNWTALETLAEVSRQIGVNEKHDDRSLQNRSAGARSRTEEPPRIDRFELQEQWTPDNPPVSYDARAQRDKKTLNNKLSFRRDSEATLPPPTFPGNMSSSPSESTNISMNLQPLKSMAAAASARFVPSMVDPQLLGEGISDLVQSGMPMDPDVSQSNNSLTFAHHGSQDGQAWPMLDGSGGSMYPDVFEGQTEQHSQVNGYASALAMNPGMTTEFSAEYGNGEKSNRAKVRGRFNPTRRKEVQEVRKLGACLRCKLLKKPCGNGQPCQTCRNVESPRSWRNTCIRSRISNELDMYSSGLHAVLAYHAVQAVKGKIGFQTSPTEIEASHYPETGIFASFKSLQGSEALQEQNIDPLLGPNADSEVGTAVCRILDNDSDDLPTKIEAYIKRMSSVFYEKEPSHFMHVTLSAAVELSIAKQDSLLTKALEMWSTVHILADHELNWFAYQKANSDLEGNQSAPINDNHSYDLIRMQLLAAVEKKTSLICKIVLSEMEKRLMQRNVDSTFESFLASLILLNCVEKSAWLYKSWEQDYLKATWPLDRSPNVYGDQGDNFLILLNLILRIRNIPPKTFNRQGDGMLAADSSQVAQEYFEKLHLNYADVLDRHLNPAFDPANSRCYELRYCGKILLPGNSD